jgi:acyl-coenzyme A thioesterase PaaI-like protein
MALRVPANVIPYARFLGVELDEDEHGTLCVLPFREEIIGNSRLPAIHGGVVGSFIEMTATLTLINDHQREGDGFPKPIGFTFDYLRSAGPKKTFARAEVVKHGRRIVNVRVIAWQDDPAKPVAAGIGNFLL